MKLYLILLSLLYSVCASSQRFVLQNKDYSLSIEKDTIFHPFQFKYDPITGLKRKVIRSGGLQNKNIFVVDSIYNGYNKLSSVRTFVNTNVYIEKSFDKNVDYIDAIKVVVIDKEFCFRILYNSDIEITEINATILDFDNYMEVKEYLYESN
ncbi:hypothetical protein J9332_34975, partial [Aquimarina celericrescens]|nr:hypothetical protein [Aquimarina celericrescens]